MTNKSLDQLRNMLDGWKNVFISDEEVEELASERGLVFEQYPHKKKSAYGIAVGLAALFLFFQPGHSLFYLIWWIPLVAALAFVHLQSISTTTFSNRIKTTLIYGSSIAAMGSIVFLNNTGTAFLLASWTLILYLSSCLFRIAEHSKNEKWIIAGLVSAALLLQPVDINRISIKLPSLSPQAHFSIYQDTKDTPVLSSHYYQRLPSYKEMEIPLSAEYQPTPKQSAPLLKITSDQDRIIYVLQDVQYRHALGLFKKTLFKVGEDNMSNLKPLPSSDTADVSYPEIGGMRIENLWKNESIWIQLPQMPQTGISLKDKATIKAVRLLLWFFIFWVAVSWRPKNVMENIK